MTFIRRAHVFIKRLGRKEDVVLVHQTAEDWERQFSKGSWDYLEGDHPNTGLVAGALLHAGIQRETFRILDVGCGTGALAHLITSTPFIAYTGFDISQSAVETARTKASKGRFVVGSAEKPPVVLTEFDAIVFNEVFFYINPQQILPLYAAGVKQGTRAYISIIRSWRSWFLWRRVRSHVAIERRFTVYDHNRGHVFDIGIGPFQSHENEK